MRFNLNYLASPLLLGTLVLSCSGYSIGQSTDDPVYVHPNQEVKVTGLPQMAATSASGDDVLAATVATVLMDPAVCCGADSALRDRVATSARMPLKQLGERVRGKHVLSDGTAITIEDRFWSGSVVRAEDIIAALLSNRPLLMDWKGHLYVLYGVTFDLNKHQSGPEERVVRRFLLVDSTKTGSAREIVWDRQKESLKDVDGVLELVVKK